MPKNLGVDIFPDPVGHFGAQWRPFWILQAVRRCRRWTSAPAPLGWYLGIFSLFSWIKNSLLWHYSAKLKNLCVALFSQALTLVTLSWMSTAGVVFLFQSYQKFMSAALHIQVKQARHGRMRQRAYRLFCWLFSRQDKCWLDKCQLDSWNLF